MVYHDDSHLSDTSQQVLEKSQDYYRNFIAPAVESVFDRYKQYVVHIDNLFVDLNKVKPEEIYHKLSDALEEELRKHIEEQQIFIRSDISAYSTSSTIEKIDPIVVLIDYLTKPARPWYLSDDQSFEVDVIAREAIVRLCEESVVDEYLDRLITLITNNDAAYHRLIGLIEASELDRLIRKYVDIKYPTSSPAAFLNASLRSIGNLKRYIGKVKRSELRSLTGNREDEDRASEENSPDGERGHIGNEGVHEGSSTKPQYSAENGADKEPHEESFRRLQYSAENGADKEPHEESFRKLQYSAENGADKEPHEGSSVKPQLESDNLLIAEGNIDAVPRYLADSRADRDESVVGFECFERHRVYGGESHVAQAIELRHSADSGVEEREPLEERLHSLTDNEESKKIVAVIYEKIAEDIKTLPEHKRREMQAYVLRYLLHGDETKYKKKQAESRILKAYVPREIQQHIMISNAGLILLAPMLPSIFSRLGYLDNRGKFRSLSSRLRAVHLLQYITGMTGRHYDHLLPLNKVLCGVDPDFPVNPSFRPGRKEKEEVIAFLESILTHWTILKGTSIAGLQETFICRNGILEINDMNWIVRVEEKTVDILLDQLTWNISVISLPWNKYLIYTEWKK